MGSGKPVCNVATPSLPQPEITLFATGLRLLANLLPLPKAKSKMWTTTMRWETSKPSKLFSLRISLNYTSAVSETTKRRWEVLAANAQLLVLARQQRGKRR